MPEGEPYQPHPAVLHILDTLPDSLSLRKTILEDAKVLLPDGDPMRDQIQMMLDALKMHEQWQQCLPLFSVVRPAPDNGSRRNADS